MSGFVHERKDGLPGFTDTYSAGWLLETYARPRLHEACSSFGIETDADILQSHLERLLGRLHELHTGRRERVEEFEREFGFTEARSLNLAIGTPLVLIPHYLFDDVNWITISIGKVTSSWQPTQFRSDLGEVVTVDQYPVIGLYRSNDDGSPIAGLAPIVYPPYNVQRVTSLYSSSRYASTKPWR